MNYGRLAVAVAAATVVEVAYGLLIYGQLLGSLFVRYPAVFRAPDAQAGYAPGMFAGIVLGMLAVTWIYAKAYSGGRGVGDGLRFGAAIGLFVIGYSRMGNYSTLNIGRELAVATMIAGILEWLAVGATIGAVYRGAARAVPKTTAV